MQFEIGSFEIDVGDDGVGLVTFSRPPVNAVSLSVYQDIGRLVEAVEANQSIRVVVLTAPDDARAWCGGADLNDFVGMDKAGRRERYRFINEQMPRFYRLDRPIVASINGAAIGIGMILAGLCDMRVAAEDARFACPEIDYGLVGGGSGLFGMLKMPEAKVRELLFTGRKFTALELQPTGFFNYVVPRAQVLAKSLEIARLIARKSLPSIKARKLASAALEGRTWMEAYLDAQVLSAELIARADSKEGVLAFLEHRRAKVVDD
jgi:enoyl-CoA hydratase/carnithine racemase